MCNHERVRRWLVLLLPFVLAMIAAPGEIRRYHRESMAALVYGAMQR